MFRTIVLALDGSEGADRAVPAAAGLAKRDDARVMVAHAQTRSLETHIGAHRARQISDLQAAGIDAEVVTAPSVLEGSALQDREPGQEPAETVG